LYLDVAIHLLQFSLNRMKTVHYLYFRKSQARNGVGRVGGLPTVRPLKRPWSQIDNNYLAFVLELRVDESVLAVPGALFVQLYQPIDEGDDPSPIAVVVNANDNDGGVEVNRHPAIENWVIESEIGTEPDELPIASPTPEYGRFLKSKLGGNDPWQEEKGRTFLGQISEMPAGLNFGGMTCSLYMESDGSVVAELH
jgi:hypothetical protein